MQYDEQQLINGLFQRLKQAEQQNGQRDAQAERQIAELVKQQPAAPYYMAQSMLIQEAALKRLQTRVQELENQLAQQQSQQPSGGGSFLSGLFGGNRNQPVQPAQNWGASTAQQPQQYASPAPTASRGSGFMAGALQTAAGVAGGVVIADMLTSMFHHSQPQEIVNIIEEPAAAASDATQNDAFNSDAFNNASDTQFLDNSDPYQADSVSDYQNDDFGSDDFSNDDDSFI
ncbi:DUF2076 domain-containing protein [Kosakonia cowanii]|jgi:hypothetical protein|uniref:DUF2076 domain-containing protein n=1 Tax=Kosakonia cowanii TaxID=208223 RepID=UPI002731C39D|nr:DUF2076 domain-containing protein [Kosakonia cowanii]WKW44566.1 DUF2076 domain-containing protein [Kosakonia cowanii]